VANSKDIKEIIRGLQERLLKKSKTAITPATDPLHYRQTSPLGADGAPMRNAIGATVDQRIAMPRNGSAAPSDATRQGPPTIGAQVSGERGPPTVSTGDTAKSPNGMVPGSIANSTQPANHLSKTTALAIATTNGPVVNGSGMIRPGSGSSAVGGAAKAAAGAISGSSFRPKHP